MVVSDTGPLISIFQTDSFELFRALFDTIHTSVGCRQELLDHDWEGAIRRADSSLVFRELTEHEKVQANEYAQRIAQHPRSKGRYADAAEHIGEAEIIALAQRPEYMNTVVLLDEQAAREVAKALQLTITGFAGALLVAADEGLLTADDVRRRLEQCQQAGTHYSNAFIAAIYTQAKGRNND